MATKLKSADLRDELVRIDTVLEATKQDEVVAHAEIRSLARLAVQPDQKEALAKIKACEGRLGQAKMAERRLHDARDQVEADLAQAVAEEDQQRREADAGEAKTFALSLGSLFGEVDRHLAEFRRAYTTCFAVIREARSRNWQVPSEELMVSKMNRALRTAFSVSELRGLDLVPLPATERCTFNSIGEAYSLAIRGGALHAVKPPVPKPQPISQAAKSDEGKPPPKGDISMRFADDPNEFTIKVPIATR
jgi:hypothetical protein